MVNCWVAGCKNQEDKKVDNISFHRFPQDTETREKWLKAFKRVGFAPSKRSKVCSAHFHPDDFIPSAFIKMLKNDAVPSVLLYDASSNTRGSHRSSKKKDLTVCRCCVPGCKDMTSPRFKFPTRDDLFREWICRLGVKEFKAFTTKSVPSQFRICARHFTARCFSKTSKHTLLDGSLPTKFLPVIPNSSTSLPDAFSHDHCYGPVFKVILKEKPEKSCADSTTHVGDEPDNTQGNKKEVMLDNTQGNKTEARKIPVQPMEITKTSTQNSNMSPISINSKLNNSSDFKPAQQKSVTENQKPIIRVIEEDEIDHFFEGVKERIRTFSKIDQEMVKDTISSIVSNIGKVKYKRTPDHSALSQIEGEHSSDNPTDCEPSSTPTLQTSEHFGEPSSLSLFLSTFSPEK